MNTLTAGLRWGRYIYSPLF